MRTMLVTVALLAATGCCCLGDLEEIDRAAAEEAGLTLEEYQAKRQAEADARREQRAAEREERKKSVGKSRLARRLDGDKWQVSTEVNPMTDQTDVIAAVDARESVRDWVGMSHRPALVVRCAQNKTEVAVRTGAQIQPGSTFQRAQIMVRLDDDPAQRVTASHGNDGRSAFLPNPITWAKRLEGRDQVAVQFTPFKQGKETIMFDVTGAGNVIQKVRDACHW